MADQTEQEPIDPWKRATARIRGLANNGGEVCPQFTYRNEVPISCERCGYEADVHLVRDLLAARAADAALLRERDEQIATLDAELARLSTHVELVQNEADDLRAQIARLSAQVEQWEREHDARADETAKEAARADEVEAERDAAQQELQTVGARHAEMIDGYEARIKRDHDEMVELTQQIATLTAALKELREDIESGAWAERNDASKRAERELIRFISAALQSTRPQE